MVATAIVLATMLDVRLDQWIAQNIPNVNITAFVDNSSAVSKRLAEVRTHKSRFTPTAQSAALPGVSTPSLPEYGTRAELRRHRGLVQHPRRPAADARRACAAASCWSTSGPTPASTASARCPTSEAWDARYRSKGLDDRRRRVARVPLREGRRQRRERDQAVRHPLPGGPGQQPRHLERVRQRVLAGRLPDRQDRARSATSPSARATTRRPRRRSAHCSCRPARGTSDRAQRPQRDRSLEHADHARDLPRHARGARAGSRTSRCLGAHTYSAPGYTLAVNDFAYGGQWTIHTYQALAGAEATIDATVQAKNVYMVLSPPAHGDGAVAVFINGRYSKTLDVTGQRLYQVAPASPTNSRHSIHLEFSAGTSGYSFTFG